MSVSARPPNSLASTTWIRSWSKGFNMIRLALSADSVYADKLLSACSGYADNCLSAYSVYADKSAYTLCANKKQIALIFYSHVVQRINVYDFKKLNIGFNYLTLTDHCGRIFLGENIFQDQKF